MYLTVTFFLRHFIENFTILLLCLFRLMPLNKYELIVEDTLVDIADCFDALAEDGHFDDDFDINMAVRFVYLT